MGNASEPALNVLTDNTTADGKAVFVFPGTGSAWTAIADELLDSPGAFAREIRFCDTAFSEFVDWSILEAVRGAHDSSHLDRVDVIQPMLFSVMVSLAAHWRSMGANPDAVLGHSHGEIAAAYVAGALSLRDAAMVVALRSKAVRTINDGDELRQALRASLSALKPRTGEIPFVSSVTGAGLDTSILDCDYWFANLRQPVLFEQAVQWSYEHGYRRFIEVFPRPVLAVGIQESLDEFAGDRVT